MAESEWVPPTEEDFNEDWILPKRALQLVAPVHRGDTTVTKRWLVSRLKAGLMITVARTFEMKGKHWSFFQVHSEFFGAWNEYGESHFWDTGDAVFHPSQGTHELRFFDIRFDPDNFTSGVPKVTQPEILPELRISPPQQQSKGGAPRKAWWDDLWIEMVRRIRADQLHPESGKELERIMLDWLGDQGIYPGEETLKKTALKLFKYLQE